MKKFYPESTWSILSPILLHMMLIILNSRCLVSTLLKWMRESPLKQKYAFWLLYKEAPKKLLPRLTLAWGLICLILTLAQQDKVGNEDHVTEKCLKSKERKPSTLEQTMKMNFLLLFSLSCLTLGHYQEAFIYEWIAS